MPTSTFILTIVVSALAGGACGYLLARYIWQDQLLEIEERRQQLRRSRLELHRERFQESTSRIHRPTPSGADTDLSFSEELEQLRLEMLLLREDHRVEKELLMQEIHQMRGDESPGDEEDARFETTDAVILDASDMGELEMASDSTPEEVESTAPEDQSGLEAEESAQGMDQKVATDDEATMEHPEDLGPVSVNQEDIDAVFSTPQVLDPEATTTESDDEDRPAAADDAPTPQQDPEITPTDMGIRSEPADSEPIKSEPETTSLEDNKAETPGRPRESRPHTSLVSPVPTDIESLFEAPRVEEPAINHKPDQETESAREPEVSEPPEQVASQDVEEAPAEAETETELDLHSEEEAQLPQPSAAAEAAASEEAHSDSSSFAIHWNADRPGRHKDQLADMPEPIDLPKQVENKEPGIPVFRSLHDMLIASGVSPANDEPTPSTPESTDSMVWTPSANVHAESAEGPSSDKALIRSIVSLDADSFSLLDELGYASLTRLAQLSESEIRRLAQVFRINPDQIEQDWKPTATAHLNLQSSKGS